MKTTHVVRYVRKSDHGTLKDTSKNPFREKQVFRDALKIYVDLQRTAFFMPEGGNDAKKSI